MKIKYATKSQLIKINNRAIDNNYNRAVVSEYLEKLPQGIVFPVTFTLLHEHAAGKPVAPHMRCAFVVGNKKLENINTIWIDVEMDLFDMLSETEVTNKVSVPKNTERTTPDASNN